MAIKTRQSQTEIAKTLGITQATVSNWLNIKARPSGLAKKALADNYPELLEKIAEAWNDRSMG